MTAHDPEDRVLSTQIAANDRWGRVPDRAETTKPAREGLRAKWAAEVDPHNTLDPLNGNAASTTCSVRTC